VVGGVEVTVEAKVTMGAEVTVGAEVVGGAEITVRLEVVDGAEVTAEAEVLRVINGIQKCPEILTNGNQQRTKAMLKTRKSL
jgi:UDP-3-O-[3-hydroxymyristoyl] glucosamine N-acyltransferase